MERGIGWTGFRAPDEPDPFIDEQLAVWVNGARRFFTMSEWLVLKYLRSHPNKFNAFDQIESWLYSGRSNEWPQSGLLKCHVCRIRKKLKGSGYTIRSHWGAGYMLERET